MYVRKSSEAEERQELSIPAQLRELTEYAKRHSLIIIGQPLEESQSAMTPGRPIFGDMMKAVEKKKADGILCWKLDRLARNPLDSGRLMQAIADGVLKEVRTPDYVYNRTGADKMLLALQFGMATKYSDDLSDNVRRGLREAAIRGYWPHRPPLGYRRDEDGSKCVVPDPKRFSTVQELWRMLLAGVPVSQIFAFARERGLTTIRFKRQGGGPLSRTELYRLFNNRFYAGLMLFKKELYPGKHQPMITVAEFEMARTILAGRQAWNLPPKRPVYVYRGLLRCGSCGGGVTVQTATNRQEKKYILYYCWKKNLAELYCPERAVQESEIDRAFSKFIDELELPPTWVKTVFLKLDTFKSAAKTAAEESRKKNMEQVNFIEIKLERLRRFLIDETITPEDYAKDKNKLIAEQARLKELAAEPFSDVGHLEPWRDAIFLLNKAKNILTSSDLEKKRELIKSLTSNVILKDKKVLIEAKKIFSVFREARGCPDEESFWDFLRTNITNNVLLN